MPIMARPILILEPVLLPVIFLDAKENQMQCSVVEWAMPIIGPHCSDGIFLQGATIRGMLQNDEEGEDEKKEEEEEEEERGEEEVEEKEEEEEEEEEGRGENMKKVKKNIRLQGAIGGGSKRRICLIHGPAGNFVKDSYITGKFLTDLTSPPARRPPPQLKIRAESRDSLLPSTKIFPTMI
ncbi:hypothetical protein LSTR_LSTR005907 [Laodelphax striatellus]|uniref:Uncharacterized protein n=1 Tax=Laodelphax striatellus TaxID=195883 RepID=A0A482WGU3_LAOST|nr:hypothetical protein LSTR_LSTR005907 [Laodelphax striatellus]